MGMLHTAAEGETASFCEVKYEELVRPVKRVFLFVTRFSPRIALLRYSELAHAPLPLSFLPNVRSGEARYT